MKRITKGGEVSIAAPVNASGSENAHFSVTGAASGGLTSAWMDGEHSIPLAYPYRLNTYACAPDYDVTIEQFEEYAYARLQGMMVPPPLRLLPILPTFHLHLYLYPHSAEGHRQRIHEIDP